MYYAESNSICDGLVLRRIGALRTVRMCEQINCVTFRVVCLLRFTIHPHFAIQIQNSYRIFARRRSTFQILNQFVEPNTKHHEIGLNIVLILFPKIENPLT